MTEFKILNILELKTELLITMLNRLVDQPAMILLD